MEKTKKQTKAVTHPTYQQNLVTDNLESLFADTGRANIQLDQRAERMAVVSGGLIAFVGGATALSGNGFAANPAATVSLALAFMLAILIFRNCAKAWGPNTTHHPTVPDPDTLYAKYIAQDVYDAYNQYLSSLTTCIEKNRTVNLAKSNAIDTVLRLVQIQLAMVALSLVLKSVGL